MDACTGPHFLPPTLGIKFALWWLLHFCGVFRNRNYAVLIVRRNGRPVHRTCLIPKYFRWPFMSDCDLQVSSTWTDPDHRCLGIATYALQHAVSEWAKEGRTLWYVTHADNAPSLSVCRNLGFRVKTAANRTSRFGVRLLGELALLDSAAGKGERSRGVIGPAYEAPSISADSGAKMNIWLATIGEPVPLEAGRADRLHRTGYFARFLANRGHRTLWWTSAFDHFRKRHLAARDETVDLDSNLRIRMLRGRGYRRNISLARLRDHAEIAGKFTREAEQAVQCGLRPDLDRLQRCPRD